MKNLLKNPGFEKGKCDPDGWIKIPSANVSYGWDDKSSVVGKRSVFIEGKSASGLGAWSQKVPVTAGAVYVFSGYVRPDNIPLAPVNPGDPASYCCLQLVFRDRENKEIKKVDLPSHRGTRDFAYDFPRELKVRAPEGAVSADVNLVLSGQGRAWFDEILFAVAPVGDISGVVTGNSKELEGAKVYIYGDPWGKKYEAITDDKGKYALRDIPVASPRYIVFAGKQGYMTIPEGNIGIKSRGETRVDFELKPGSDPIDYLRVKFGSMALCKRTPSVEVPRDAVIPADKSGYPAHAGVFLEPDEYVQSDDPEVKKLAARLLKTVPGEKRNNTYEVAYAVFSWMCKNLEHDGLYSYRGPVEGRAMPVENNYRDVTSGIWQTVTEEGWSWGRNMLDWCYKPGETLREKGVICIELSWLICAIYRNLNIPARTSIGSNEIWVQKPSGGGFWVHMSTTFGRAAYREMGEIGSFGGMAPPLLFSVKNRPLVHEDWGMEKKSLWREIHPFVEEYEYSENGLNQAVKDMEQFRDAGEVPYSSTPPRKPEQLTCIDDVMRSTLPPEALKDITYYLIRYSDIELNLAGVEQETLDVRFPFVSESGNLSYAGHEAYWTNHPECVVRTWVEEITNPPAEGKEKWFHIEFDLTALLGK